MASLAEGGLQRSPASNLSPNSVDTGASSLASLVRKQGCRAECTPISYNEYLEFPRARALLQLDENAQPVFTTAERVTNIILEGTGTTDVLLVADNDGNIYFRWSFPDAAVTTNIDVRFFAHNGLRLSTVGGEDPQVTVFWVDLGGPGADKTPS